MMCETNWVRSKYILSVRKNTASGVTLHVLWILKIHVYFWKRVAADKKKKKQMMRKEMHQQKKKNRQTVASAKKKEKVIRPGNMSRKHVKPLLYWIHHGVEKITSLFHVVWLVGPLVAVENRFAVFLVVRSHIFCSKFGQNESHYGQHSSPGHVWEAH